MLLKIEKTKWKNCKEIIMKLMDRNKFLTPYSEYNFLNRIKKLLIFIDFLKLRDLN